MSLTKRILDRIPHNISDLEPLSDVPPDLFRSESGDRYVADELSVGNQYYTRFKREFGGDAGEYLTEIATKSSTRLRFVWPGILLPTVKIGLIPVNADGQLLEDLPDSRLISPDGLIYSGGVRFPSDGYFKNRTDEFDLAFSELLADRPTQPLIHV